MKDTLKDAKYKALVAMLKKGIADGKYDAHRPFPSLRAIINRSGFSKTTVQRALDELVHHGLIFREQGRGTFVRVQTKPRKIGLIVPGISYSEFFPPVVAEILRLSNQNGCALQIGDVTAEDAESRVRRVRQLADEMIKTGVAGVIYHPIEFVGASRVNEEVVAAFDRANVRVVCIDRPVKPPPGGPEHDVVGIDNFKAGCDLAEHLASVGARKICFLARKGLAPLGNRYEGIRAVVSRGARRCVDVLLPDTDSPRKLASELRRLKPDAVVCANDAIAARFRQTLEKLGLRVPQDILLAGFDDLSIASLMTPPLTTVHQPCAEIADVAFRRLLERIANPSLPVVAFCLSAPVVVRASTCPEPVPSKSSRSSSR